MSKEFSISQISKYIFIIPAVFLFFVSCSDTNLESEQWSVYGGGNHQIKYSSLGDIDTNNVKDLEVAWVYHTKDAERLSQMQTNSIIVDNVLYGVSPRLKLFAVDAATGKEKWIFDPRKYAGNWIDTWKNRRKINLNVNTNVCRGVAYYRRNKDSKERIFYTVGSVLICVDAISGLPVTSFGNNGILSLHDNLEKNRDISDLRVTSTSPGIIYKDLIIVGTSLSETPEAAPGHIRAYDVHTGELKWIFHTIPKPGEVGYETWEDPEAYKYVGGANAWGGFSLDEKRGLVFASTGTANPDFYGGKRKGDNLFANSVVALDAETGELKWYFQTIHHDLWDWDLAPAPVLVTIKKEEKKIDAVVQASKQGFIYVLDRVTGEPVYPIEERSVPTFSELEGEWLSPTQPFPTFFPPFARQEFTEADLNRIVSDSSYQDIKRRFESYTTGEMFTPPSKKGTVVLPGFDGGANWGGPSFDPKTGILYINATEMPWIVTANVDEAKVKKKDHEVSVRSNLQVGEALYRINCMGCHGQNREGMGGFPPLIGIEKRFTEREFKDVVTTGRNMMPAFSYLNGAEKTALASYILNLKDKQVEKFVKTEKQIDPFYTAPPYYHKIEEFLTVEGYPAISPPWGTLTAINLNTGELVWKNPLGDYPELKAKGIHSGRRNFGGSVVTAGGLLFIAATPDEKFRAFNKRTGELLFEVELPAAGYATPSVYRVNGKEYVVIACGGGKMHNKSGDAYVAFSLPDKIKD